MAALAPPLLAKAMMAQPLLVLVQLAMAMLPRSIPAMLLTQSRRFSGPSR